MPNGSCNSILKLKNQSFFLQVLIPKGAYNGQKLIKLVKTKTPPKINSTKPKVPSITCVKYNTAITIATINRIIRSAPPIFAFIFLSL